MYGSEQLNSCAITESSFLRIFARFENSCESVMSNAILLTLMESFHYLLFLRGHVITNVDVGVEWGLCLALPGIGKKLLNVSHFEKLIQ